MIKSIIEKDFIIIITGEKLNFYQWVSLSLIQKVKITLNFSF